MKVNGYEINVMCANAYLCSETAGSPESDEFTYGDIYDTYEDCVEDHPDEDVLYGYYLKKERVETPDWFNSIEEAVNWALTH